MLGTEPGDISLQDACALLLNHGPSVLLLEFPSTGALGQLFLGRSPKREKLEKSKSRMASDAVGAVNAAIPFSFGVVFTCRQALAYAIPACQECRRLHGFSSLCVTFGV